MQTSRYSNVTSSLDKDPSPLCLSFFTNKLPDSHRMIDSVCHHLQYKVDLTADSQKLTSINLLKAHKARNKSTTPEIFIVSWYKGGGHRGRKDGDRKVQLHFTTIRHFPKRMVHQTGKQPYGVPQQRMGKQQQQVETLLTLCVTKLSSLAGCSFVVTAFK